MSKSRRSPRALALCLVVLLGAMWPLAAWHEFTTTHAVCAEHGERLDVAHGATSTPHDGPVVADLESNGHDQCPFAPLAQPAEDDGRAPRAPVMACIVGPMFVRADAPRAPTFPLYLLAPKQSPPSGLKS